LVLATRNAHKLEELRRILVSAGVEIELVGLEDFPDAPEVAETGVTFAENARLKAHAAVAVTGLPAVADDSGLCVDVLGGMPGVFSARWSGRHGDDVANLQLLLNQLSDVDREHRAAQFVCAAVLVTPDGRELVVEENMTGRISSHAVGDQGFGYDPIFVPDGERRTSAQLSAAEKDAVSHRGKALRALATAMPRFLGLPA